MSASSTLIERESLAVDRLSMRRRARRSRRTPKSTAISRSHTSAKAASAIAIAARLFELVAGSVLVGHAGDEFVCTHEHHDCGDECLSFQFQARDARHARSRFAHRARKTLESRRRAAAARAHGARRAGPIGRGRTERCRPRRSRTPVRAPLRRDRCPAATPTPRSCTRATGAAPSRPRCASTIARTNRSISTARRMMPASAHFTFCACSPRCSA